VFLISEFLIYNHRRALQTSKIPARILLALGVNELYVCQNCWPLDNSELEVGQLMVIKDHMNISCQLPGLGPNHEGYGPRFYETSSIYNSALKERITETAKALEIPCAEGNALWINQSSIPSYAHSILAKNLDMDFKAVLKNGVAEVMAGAQLNQGKGEIQSVAISLVSDSVITAQDLRGDYLDGIINLFQLLERVFE